MDNQFHIQAHRREQSGKSHARRSRHDHKIPGIIYGGESQPTMIWMDEKSLNKTLSYEAVQSHVLTLDVSGEKKVESVVLKNIQRHGYLPKIIHCDFLRVNHKTAITLRVPVHFEHENENPLVSKKSAILSKHVDHIDVQCLPKDLPEFIAIDVKHLEMDSIVHLSDIQWPKGVESVALAHDNDMAVVSLHAPKMSSSDTTDIAASVSSEEADANDAGA